METVRAQFVAAALGGRVYVFGGEGGAEGTAERYDPATGVWDPLPLAPYSYTFGAGTSAAVVSDKLYVVGGGHDDASDDLCFDPESHTWDALPRMQHGRRFCAAGALDGQLFVCGGRAKAPDQQPLRSVERYDTTGGVWLDAPSLLAAIAHCRGAALVRPPSLYAISCEAPFVVHRFSLETGQWTALPPQQSCRGVMGVAACGGNLYLFGSQYQAGSTPYAECFDTVKGAWHALPSMMEARICCSAVEL